MLRYDKPMMKSKLLGAIPAGGVVLVLLAGCGAPSPQSFSPPTSTQQAHVAGFHIDHRPSWASPEAKNDNLLYVSDQGTYDVYMYSYPAGKLVGTLTDQNNPSGMCVDAKGDVFVTQLYGGGHIVEYAHGGTSAIESLSDPGYEPGACGIDPSTGDLAVANIVTDYFGTGDLLIFKDAKGSPTAYPAPSQSTAGGEWGSVNAVAYDDKQNVFVAGHAYPDQNVFAELPKGAGALENITLDQDFGSGLGNVQWDGKDITFSALQGDVYRFVVKGTKGKEVGSTILKNSTEVPYSWIEGSTIVTPQQSAKEVMFYKYPRGGKPTKKAITGFSVPMAVTISLAKQQ